MDRPAEESNDDRDAKILVPPIVIRASSSLQQEDTLAARPVSWEDDISSNALDDLPFENLEPPNRMPEGVFESDLYRSVAELLGTESLDPWLQRDSFPIPSTPDREGYFPDSPTKYWLSGLRDYARIMQTAKRRGTEVRSYLDVGCSTGRLIRHFCAHGELDEIWGADINERSIRWLSSYLPENVKPFTNTAIPTLPIRDNSVDAISAFSVFTHIDTFESSWLAELARIISSRGFAFVTIHNEDTWTALRDEVDSPDNRLVQSMIRLDPDTPEKLQKAMPNTRLVYRMTDVGPYRSQVFHSNEYIHRVWGRYFKVSRILPRRHGLQALVVLFAK